MIVMNIAEWIANLLVLGIGLVFWAIAIFMISMMVSIAGQWINQQRGDNEEKKEYS